MKVHQALPSCSLRGEFHRDMNSKHAKILRKKRVAITERCKKMLCKGRDGWQSTNQSGIFSATSQSLHPIRHQAETCPALSGTQRAPAAAQEAPGMCFSLINLSDSSVGLAVMQSGNLYIWQSPLVPAVWPRQAACNNTGYLFSCASPLDPGEKRYVLPL